MDPDRLVSLFPRLDPIRLAAGSRTFEVVQVGADGTARTGDGDLGPATAREGELVCDLPSPVAVGSAPCYRLGLPDGGRSLPGVRHVYRWTVRQRADGRPIWRTVTSEPEVRITAAAPGRYVVDVAVLADGAPTGERRWLDHDVELEPEPLTLAIQGTSPDAAQAMRELVNDLRPYIIEAAAATGPGGITARLLAAALFIEILGRPKAERELELDGLAALIGALERGERVLFPGAATDRPLGVGQIRPVTAAMVTGAAPWIERDLGERRPAGDPARAHYEALPLQAKRAIFTQLRWPRSNIALAARLLTRLKNRPHRFPALTRAQLAADPHAVGIVATEYVSGASLAPAAGARPSGHGTWVWHQMQDSLVQRFFPDD